MLIKSSTPRWNLPLVFLSELFQIVWSFFHSHNILRSLFITFNFSLLNLCSDILLEHMMILLTLSSRICLWFRLRVRCRYRRISITISNSIRGSILSFSLTMRVNSLLYLHSLWRIYHRLEILSHLFTKGFLLLENGFFLQLFLLFFCLIIDHLLKYYIPKSTFINVMIKLMLEKSFLFPWIFKLCLFSLSVFLSEFFIFLLMHL